MVKTKEKEDSSMEEMRTKEKQIVYDQALYEKAYEFAKEKHGTQKRIGGDPYITHPVAVADILKKEGYDIEYQIVALFHDLLEDTDATEDEIRSIGGEEVHASGKTASTKEKGYDMQTYVNRIRQNPIAYAVKGARPSPQPENRLLHQQTLPPKIHHRNRNLVPLFPPGHPCRSGKTQTDPRRRKY